MKTDYIFRKLRSLGLFLATSALSFSVFADSYIIVGNNAKVFDEPNSNYVTLNQKNVEVKPEAGMVFKAFENSAGWTLVEYSPGLRGYISDIVKVTKSVMPKAGSYTVCNNPKEKIVVKSENGVWSATIGSNTYNGKAFGNVIVFFDDKNIPTYSLIDMGKGGIVMSYDNNVTKFF